MQYIKDMLATGLSGLGGMIGSLIGGMFGGGGEDEEGAGGKKGEKKSGGIFVGLDSALEKLAGLVAVGGVVYLAIKGFQTLLQGFANPTVILGAGVLAGLLLGTGGAIALAGQGISAAGDGLSKMADGVERMAAVKDTANLANVAESLGSLGSAMLGLAAGGVLDSIASFFGAKSPFDKMVEGINKFANIDSTAVENLTGSASGLANLKSFTDGLDSDGVKSYAKALNELAEAMKKLNVVLADSNTGRKESGYSVSDMLSSEGGLGGGGISSSNMQSMIQLMRTNNTLLTKILDKNPESAY